MTSPTVNQWLMILIKIPSGTSCLLIVLFCTILKPTFVSSSGTCVVYVNYPSFNNQWLKEYQSNVKMTWERVDHPGHGLGECNIHNRQQLLVGKGGKRKVSRGGKGSLF